MVGVIPWKSSVFVLVKVQQRTAMDRLLTCLILYVATGQLKTVVSDVNRNSKICSGTLRPGLAKTRQQEAERELRPRIGCGAMSYKLNLTQT